MSEVAHAVGTIMRLNERTRHHGIFANGKSASAADNPSTTNTSTFVDALVWQWNELPDGLYVVTIDASLMLAHSAAGQASMRLVCNGVLGTDYNPAVPNESPPASSFRILHTFTEVAADTGTGITLAIEYKGLTAGTTSAKNPAIAATAIRVG